MHHQRLDHFLFGEECLRDREFNEIVILEERYINMTMVADETLVADETRTDDLCGKRLGRHFATEIMNCSYLKNGPSE